MTRQRSKKILIGIGIVAATILYILFLLVGYDKIIPALTPQEEPFTELYFENHLTIPKVLPLNTPYRLSFTIHNLEGKIMLYPYKVYRQDESIPPNITELFSSEVLLEKGDSKTTELDIIIPKFSTQREKIVVELPELQQTIHFWTLVSSVSATASVSATPTQAPRR